MEIDLTDPEEFTIDAVRRLLGSKDDSQNRQLRVTKRGLAYLSDEVGAQKIDHLAFRFETWIAGNGYCGLEAVKNDKWVASVFEDLKENWPNPKSTYIDF